MLKLIYKDLVVQKREKTPLVAIILSILNAVTLQSQLGWSVAISVFTVYLFVVYANAFDYKYNGEMLVNSLPVRRSTIVAAKYLSVYVYLAVVFVITLLAGMIMKAVGVPTIDSVLGLNLVVFTVFLSSVYYAVFFPLYFKLDYMKARWINYLALLVVMVTAGLMNQAASLPTDVVPSSAEGLLSTLAGHASGPTNLVMLAVAVVLTGISFAASRRIYAYKEF